MRRKPGQGKGKTNRITSVGITKDTLTSRGGLSLFGRYLEGIGIRPTFERLFGSMRKNGKGQPIDAIMKQVLCYFMDGTSRHLVHFDRLKEDAGYAGAIESAPERLVSSHAVKRFFNAFSGVRIWLFRRLLQGLFLWRLKVIRSAVIELGIDAMVMNNDEAEVRHGVQPTYKKVKGFQPLQMTWGRFIVDAVDEAADLPEVLVEFEEIDDFQIVWADDIGEVLPALVEAHAPPLGGREVGVLAHPEVELLLAHLGGEVVDPVGVHVHAGEVHEECADDRALDVGGGGKDFGEHESLRLQSMFADIHRAWKATRGVL
jgi:hypothetical protein